MHAPEPHKDGTIMMNSKKPKEATPRQIGQHIYHHQIQTQAFVTQWHGLMLKLSWVLAFGAGYSTWQVLQTQGWAMTPTLAFELFSVALAFATAMYVQHHGHPTALHLCLVLVVMQLFACGSSAYNRARYFALASTKQRGQHHSRCPNQSASKRDTSLYSSPRHCADGW